MEVNNRVALVTGGAHGIGRALCRALNMEGAKVAVADLDIDAARKIAEEVGGMALLMDVADEASIAAGIEHAETELGPIDIFVSNAGVAFGDGAGGAASAPNEHWRACIDINLMAHVYAARVMVPKMKQRGGGCLVNVSSAAGLLAQVGEAAYTATKHAAVGFAESLAITHGDDGIHVVLVCPQAVATRMAEEVSTGPGAAAAVDGVITAEQVADAVVQGLAEEDFLILPHPEVAEYRQHKAASYDRWLGGMRKLRRAIGFGAGA